MWKIYFIKSGSHFIFRVVKQRYLSCTTHHFRRPMVGSFAHNSSSKCRWQRWSVKRLQWRLGRQKRWLCRYALKQLHDTHPYLRYPSPWTSLSFASLHTKAAQHSFLQSYHMPSKCQRLFTRCSERYMNKRSTLYASHYHWIPCWGSSLLLRVW